MLAPSLLHVLSVPAHVIMHQRASERETISICVKRCDWRFRSTGRPIGKSPIWYAFLSITKTVVITIKVQPVGHVIVVRVDKTLRFVKNS